MTFGFSVVRRLRRTRCGKTNEGDQSSRIGKIELTVMMDSESEELREEETGEGAAGCRPLIVCYFFFFAAFLAGFFAAAFFAAI